MKNIRYVLSVDVSFSVCTEACANLSDIGDTVQDITCHTFRSDASVTQTVYRGS